MKPSLLDKYRHLTFLRPAVVTGGIPDTTRSFTIRAGRRRPPGDSSAPRERAEAPQRQRESGGSSGGSPFGNAGGSGGSGSGGFGGFGGSGGGSMLPTGGRGTSCLSMGLGLVLLIVLALVFGPGIFTGGVTPDDILPQQQEQQPLEPSNNQQPAVPFGQPEAPTRPPLVAATPKPTRALPAPSASQGKTWTVMMYVDADDKILEEDLFVDLNEAERVGSTDQVKIVAQMDRFRGGFSGGENWTGAKRFLVTRDDDLTRIGSEELDDMGEINMSSGETLVDFVTWAVRQYPADKYALILSDHGMGWPGGWSDTDSAGRSDNSTPLGSAAGDQLYLHELDDALAQIQSVTGLDRLELIGMDACLMGHLEVLEALEPYARYAVVSQETEPSLGWAYTKVLQTLTANPGMDGANLGQTIVDSYIRDDQRIVDEQARADLLRQTSGVSGLFGAPPRVSADQLASQLGADITLSTVDLSGIPDLNRAVNDFAYALQSADQRAVAQARSYARSFTSIFGSQSPPSYIDLGNFIQLFQQQSGDAQVSQAGDRVLQSINQVVIANKTGPKRRGANGISIYFPNSTMYSSPVSGPRSYTAIANRFAQQSLWDDFLAFHYTDRSFQPQDTSAVVPSRAVTAPGAEQIQIDEITKSADTAAPGQPVLLSTRITGQNIGYIYLFAGFLDQTGQSIFLADMDYLETPNTREVDGNFYPVWETGGFNLEFEWEPLMFAITDGTQRQNVLLRPESYGANPEQAVYSVDGIYTYADSGDTRSARMYFSNGQMTRVMGFTSGDATGAPWEIVPTPGDQFTILEQWLDLGASGQPATPATQQGDTLTFGAQNITWQELDAAAGTYVVGFIVTDLDGNRYEKFTQVQVQ